MAVHKTTDFKLELRAELLVVALERIERWEYRSDHRQRNMVDVEELQHVRRIARTALKKWEESK